MPPPICKKFDYQRSLKIAACEKLCLSCWLGPIKTWLERPNVFKFAFLFFLLVFVQSIKNGTLQKHSRKGTIPKHVTLQKTFQDGPNQKNGTLQKNCPNPKNGTLPGAIAKNSMQFPKIADAKNYRVKN